MFRVEGFAVEIRVWGISLKVISFFLRGVVGAYGFTDKGSTDLVYGSAYEP